MLHLIAEVEWLQTNIFLFVLPFTYSQPFFPFSKDISPINYRVSFTFIIRYEMFKQSSSQLILSSNVTHLSSKCSTVEIFTLVQFFDSTTFLSTSLFSLLFLKLVSLPSFACSCPPHSIVHY